MPEKKPIILTWWPIIFVSILGLTSTAVDAYRLDQLETSVETVAESKVSKETYDIQLADVVTSHEELKKEVNQIKTLQSQQNDVRIRQEAMRDQLRENKDDIKSLDNKMDEKFDDLKDFIRENVK